MAKFLRKHMREFLTERMKEGRTLREATIDATGDDDVESLIPDTEYGLDRLDAGAWQEVPDFAYDLMQHAYGLDFFGQSWLVDVLLAIPLRDGRVFGDVTYADLEARQRVIEECSRAHHPGVVRPGQTASDEWPADGLICACGNTWSAS